MIRYIFYIFWLAWGCLYGVVHGQPNTFDTLYTQGHIGYALMPNDSGYAIAGNHHNGEFWLFQVNQEGQMIWEQTYGRRYGLFDAASMYDAAATLDGYFLAGHSYSIPDTNWGGKSFGYVVKAGPEGHQLWDRMFYTTYDSSRSSRFYNVTPTPDGGCLLSGEAIVNPDVTILSDTRFWVVKLDSLGNVEFDRLYKNSDPGYTYDTGHNEAIAYSDGFLIGTSYNHGRKGYLMRLDLNGDTLWTRKYDRLPGDEQRRLVMIEDMVELADGGYLLAARSFLIRTDSLGNLLWRQPDILANRLAWLPDGNLIAHIGGVLQKITPDGQILWQRDYTSYDLNPVDFIRFSAVSHAHDGGLMLLYDNLSGLGLMKTDCEGNLVNPVACAATAIEPPVAHVAFEVVHLPDRWRVSYDQLTRGGQLQLCNLMGQVLESKNLISAQPTTDWSHTHLAPGLYLLQLRDSQGRLLSSQKVIKY